MNQQPPAILISDADVLIDYATADVEVLEIMAKTLWQLHVALPILKEVRALTVAKAEKIGIVICEPTLEELTAAASSDGSLSGPDRLCLAIARSRNWACLTNDQTLRRSCQAAGVQLVWGLEAMVLLHKSGHLARAHAEKTAKAIHAINPLHIHKGIIDRFLQQLDS